MNTNGMLMTPEVADRLLVGPDLARIFTFRETAVARLFAAGRQESVRLLVAD